MFATKIVLPYEAQYAGHRETEKRHKETRDRLQQRERKLAERQSSPSLVPEHVVEYEKAKAASVGLPRARACAQ
jgi:hypothetical protein